jgi:hypothetical protein
MELCNRGLEEHEFVQIKCGPFYTIDKSGVTALNIKIKDLTPGVRSRE